MTIDLYRYRELADARGGRGRVVDGVEQGELQRVSRGIYSPAAPVSDDDLLRALFLRLPEGTALGFHSAAARYGFGVLRSDPVHVVIPPGQAKPRIGGVVAHEAVLGVDQPVVVDGIPCVPPARCAIDLARQVRRIDALPVVDAALRAGACDPDTLMAELARHAGLRGVCQARELVPLGDARAECRQESQLRLVLIDGRLPVPEPQVWVVDDLGAGRYRIDLAYRRRRVGVEYDGISHTDRNRLRHDRTRMNWLAARGWTMRYFTDYDLYRRPSGIVTAVRTALNS